MGSLSIRIVADTSQLSGSLKNAQRSMKKFGQTAQQMGRSLSLYITAPLVLAGREAINLANNFEESMSKIENLVGVSSDAVAQFAEDIKGVQKTTAVSKNELADALFVVTSAGQKGANAMKILEASAKASAVGLGETKEIARAVTAALNAYKNQNLTAAQAADVLFATVKEGNLDATELAGSMGRLLGPASTLGIGFDELGASIATFTRLGTPVEEAVTGLAAIMSAVIKPSVEAKDAMDELGLTSQQLRDSIDQNGLANTLVNLIDVYDGNVEALARVFPNVRALRTVLGTAAAQGKEYIDIQDSISNSAGIMERGFANVQKTGFFAFKQLTSSFQALGEEFGSALVEVIMPMVQALQGMADKFRELSPTTKKYVAVAALLAAAIGPLLLIVGQLAIAFAAINFQTLAIIGAVAALSAAIIYLVNNWQAVKTTITNVFNSMYLAVLNAVSGMASALDALFSKIGVNVFGEFQKNLVKVKQKVATEMWQSATTFSNFGDTVGTVMDEASQQIKSFVDTASSSAISYQNSVSEMGRVTIEKMPTIKAGWIDLKNTIDNFSTASSAKMEAVKTNVSQFSIDISKAMVDMVQNTSKIFGDFVEEIIAGADQLTTADLFNRLLKMVGDVMKEFGAAMIAMGTQLLLFESSMATMNPFGMMAAGAALVTAGAVLAGIAQKGFNSFANGGVVFGPTLAMVGDNKGARNNPEIIAPLDKLKSIMGDNGMQTVHVVGRISGRDILLTNERAQQDREVLRG